MLQPYFKDDLLLNELYIGKLNPDNLRDGFGLQIFPNELFYLGYWKDNKAHGTGIF